MSDRLTHAEAIRGIVADIAAPSPQRGDRLTETAFVIRWADRLGDWGRAKSLVRAAERSLSHREASDRVDRAPIVPGQ